MAGEESFWFDVQQAFAVDRSVINLNNGGVSPAPRFVLDAARRHFEFANQLPSRNLWTILDPQVETVRKRLARAFNCDAEEMAITRNSSEALEIAILGLDLQPGDEILSTAQDYPRMLNTIKQREQREKIVLKTFDYPTPPPSLEFLVGLFEKNITPRTKVILVSHMTTYTGQVFPVQRISAMARARGIKCIVDGAHAFGQIAFDGGAIGCDFYGTSLHKWLTAPHGTGFLYVRKENITGHWPMMAAPDPKKDDIRKFEEIGTHSDAARLAIAEALVFYEGLGPERKEARLRFLRDRFARRLSANERVTLRTSLDPAQSCALATLNFTDVDRDKLVAHLWNQHKIVVSPISHPGAEGIRVSPNVYTTLGEIDMFCDVIEKVLRDGLPA
ncbi:MAG: aminotransferase class V-fold PLP-dependent enzyme [Phycisphaerales bacterium]|nr:aminotransferase class V-fold PLP-dependent enzyme [Phycisphaerales bacterium]